MPSTPHAAVFLTYYFDAEMEKRYLHLKRTAGENCQVFLMADKGAHIPEQFHAETVFFDYAALACDLDQTPATTKGKGHLMFMKFWRTRPEFQFYWFIEYDVVFTGPWSLLLDECSRLPADYWSTHIRPRTDEPGWCFWPEFNQVDELKPEHWVRSFAPICGLSPAGLSTIEDLVREGWRGHAEMVVPSALLHKGLTVRDFGGQGRWVPEGWKNRFYTSDHTPAGRLVLLGSFRYYPSHFFPWKKNTLYHPVKPRAHWRSSLLQWFGLLQRTERREFLRDHPHFFSRK